MHESGSKQDKQIGTPMGEQSGRPLGMESDGAVGLAIDVPVPFMPLANAYLDGR